MPSLLLSYLDWSISVNDHGYAASFNVVEVTMRALEFHFDLVQSPVQVLEHFSPSVEFHGMRFLKSRKNVVMHFEIYEWDHNI